PGGGVYTGDVPCRGDNDQTWQWVYLGDNASKLVNKSTRHCLGTSNGEVRDLSCGGGASQAWYRDPNGKIRQVSSNGFLSSDWAGEVFLSDGGTASSRWY
ncbi:MAG: hypothetical protein QOH03_4292, partial [Kribbellaceae bacterium]|nr:hypothetical protein [Kribbellaceae bacterium]